jgi:hypothetical protein
MGALLCWAPPLDARISITPRFSGYFDNSVQRQSSAEAIGDRGATDRLDDIGQTLRSLFGNGAGISIGDTQLISGGNQTFFAMGGASVTVPVDDRTQLTLTGLYGSTHGDVRVLSTSTQRLTVAGVTAQDLLVSSTQGRIRLRRIDVELSAQRRLTENFSLTGGARIERVRERLVAGGEFEATQNGANLIRALSGDPALDPSLSVSHFTATSRGTTTVYSLRGGGAAFAPIGGGQSFYVNGMLHVSRLPVQARTLNLIFVENGDHVEAQTKAPGEWSAGPDVSVGYSLRINDRLGLDARYRGVFYFPLSGVRKISDPRVNHGFNVGVSVAL